MLKSESNRDREVDAAKRPMRELILILVFVITFPVVAYISTLPAQRFRNVITEWGDPDSAAYREFVDYRNKFGINEFVVVSWPGCDLNDSRVEVVTEKIEANLEGRVQQVSSGQRAYKQLRNRARLDDLTTMDRLRNAFIAKDDLSTAIGFNLTEAGRLDREMVVHNLEEILESAGVPPGDAIYAGLGHNLYTLDKEGLESPFRMVPQIMLAALVLTILFVHHFGLAFFINALGVYSGCLAFNFVHLADIDMNAIIWPLPTLTMLLSVSASLHFLGYFRSAVAWSMETKGWDPDQPFSLQRRRVVTKRATQLASKPILYCTLTTAIGLLSLSLSTSQPVRQFGLFGALSIAAANILLLFWFPAFLTVIRYADRVARRDGQRKKQLLKQEPQAGGWHLLAGFTQRFRWLLIYASVCMLIWCAAGIPKIKTGSNLENFFPRNHQVLTDAVAIEQSAGPLNSVELLLTFKNHDPENDRLRLKGIQALTSRIVEETPFVSCISAATFTPDWRRRATGIRRAMESTRMKTLKDEMLETGLLFRDSETNKESWRVSCRYSTLDQVDVLALNLSLIHI